MPPTPNLSASPQAKNKMATLLCEMFEGQPDDVQALADAESKLVSGHNAPDIFISSLDEAIDNFKFKTFIPQVISGFADNNLRQVTAN